MFEGNFVFFVVFSILLNKPDLFVAIICNRKAPTQRASVRVDDCLIEDVEDLFYLGIKLTMDVR